MVEISRLRIQNQVHSWRGNTITPQSVVSKKVIIYHKTPPKGIHERKILTIRDMKQVVATPPIKPKPISVTRPIQQRKEYTKPGGRTVVKNRYVAPPRVLAPVRADKQRAINNALNRNVRGINSALNRNVRPSRVYHTKLNQDKTFASFDDKIRALHNIGSGKALIMVACGPSAAEAPLQLLANHPKIDFMAINSPYGYYKDGRCPTEHTALWPMKYWAFCDNSQQKRNAGAWAEYKGTIINSIAIRARHPNQILIRNRGGRGFSIDLPTGFYIGRSSTFANMQTAYYMGYDKIYIFGLDMCEVGGKLHHYGQNPDVSNENRKSRFAEEAKSYDYAADFLGDNRNRFVICSSYNPFEFANKFPRMDQKEAPQKILAEFTSKNKI